MTTAKPDNISHKTLITAALKNMPSKNKKRPKINGSRGHHLCPSTQLLSALQHFSILFPPFNLQK